jgi:uncharacterized protein (TIGR00369 family)
MAHVPQDPDFEARVRRSFARQRFMETLGAAIERVAPGEVDVAVPFAEKLQQHHGFLHAGVGTTLMDNACGYAALTLMPPGAAVLSVEFKVNLLSPGKGESFVARGRVLRHGRTVTVCTADLVARHGGVEKLVATMTGTMMTVVGRGIED